MQNCIRTSVICLALAVAYAQAQAADPGQPRLKYRSKGPVCSCATGTGEAEIRKAWEARFGQPDNSRSEPLDRLIPPSDEQRSHTNESQAR
jgi:hypothetical protein